MTLVPSRQFYPTTASTHLQFFRYTSSNHFKNQSLFFTQGSLIISQSKSNLHPHSKLKIKCSKWVLFAHSSTWLGNWNQTRVQSRPKPPKAVLDYRENENDSDSGDVRISGGSTMERIVEKLKRLGYVDDVSERRSEGRVVEKKFDKESVEDLLYVEEGVLPNSRGGFSTESPLGFDNVFGERGEVKFPWEKEVEREEERFSVRQKNRTNLAEMTLPESEMRRLRNAALRVKSKMRIGGAGVNQSVVETIHEKWKSSEVVKLKFEGAPALNMRRMHEILERKTGGLVIWRSGTSVTLYRGVTYESPSDRANKRKQKKNESPYDSSFPNTRKTTSNSLTSTITGEHVSRRDSESKIEEIEDMDLTKSVSYEDEVDKLLEGLGPRFTDWPGDEPLPVDADLLPAFVPGYEPPFRLLPYGVRSTLSGREATDLRRLARVLPPHFALGRSRQHQGLAVAMIKLWEKSSIAKIAIKRGVQLTTSERMAEDIKKLTGGMLLSRNKDFLVYYRGKNFLSPEVAEALLEKERLAKSLQDEEEQARLRASASTIRNSETNPDSHRAGSLEETLDANARWAKKLDESDKVKVLREAEVLRHANLVRKLESKLGFAERKLIKAERAKSKVEESLSPAERQSDESITDEERFMFRKLGLRMKAFLLLGRRGVFGGTVENMHLHWKYRELVKIMVKAKSFEEVKNVALSLEAESGGVLVSVDRVSKGYAIIVFRGKDYQRPSALRPKNLLTKRKALARSIELQRSEALLNHISTLQTRVAKLRDEIEQMATVKGSGDEQLYNELDSAYPTEDEDSEEEQGEAYVDTNDDGEDENDHSVHNYHLQTNYEDSEEDEHSDSDGADKSVCSYQSDTNFPYDFQDQELEEPGDQAPYATVNKS